MKTTFVKRLLACVAATLGLAFFAATPVFADCSEPNPNACANNICNCICVSEKIKSASGCGGTAEADVKNVVQNILNSIILVLGLVAVVFVVIGGIGYMTSAGDAGKMKKAKDTILYACIGLIVTVLSFAIVNFAIGIINNATGSGTSSPETTEPEATEPE